jgi:magnesium-protoporphyrin O-methyltransferase
MACCTRYCSAEEQFGIDRAERDLQRYRRRGVEGITRILLTELRRWPLQGKALLDIGGGIGVVGWELADAGVASTTLVEASPAYLDVAQREVERQSTSQPAKFVLGDFTLVADTLPETDVVILDRVVCCYPDAETLLKAATIHTRQLLAFTYPRDRWYVRLITSFQNLVRRIRGNAFRTFVHSPQQMSSVLERAGLVRDSRRGTLVWMVDFYHRRVD